MTSSVARGCPFASALQPPSSDSGRARTRGARVRTRSRRLSGEGRSSERISACPRECLVASDDESGAQEVRLGGEAGAQLLLVAAAAQALGKHAVGRRRGEDPRPVQARAHVQEIEDRRVQPLDVSKRPLRRAVARPGAQNGEVARGRHRILHADVLEPVHPGHSGQEPGARREAAALRGGPERANRRRLREVAARRGAGVEADSDAEQIDGRARQEEDGRGAAARRGENGARRSAAAPRRRRAGTRKLAARHGVSGGRAGSRRSSPKTTATARSDSGEGRERGEAPGPAAEPVELKGREQHEEEDRQELRAARRQTLHDEPHAGRRVERPAQRREPEDVERQEHERDAGEGDGAGSAAPGERRESEREHEDARVTGDASGEGVDAELVAVAGIPASPRARPSSAGCRGRSEAGSAPGVGGGGLADACATCAERSLARMAWICGSQATAVRPRASEAAAARRPAAAAPSLPRPAATPTKTVRPARAARELALGIAAQQKRGDRRATPRESAGAALREALEREREPGEERPAGTSADSGARR